MQNKHTIRHFEEQCGCKAEERVFAYRGDGDDHGVHADPALPGGGGVQKRRLTQKQKESVSGSEDAATCDTLGRRRGDREESREPFTPSTASAKMYHTERTSAGLPGW
jgi:hypothetical protein